MKSSPAQTPRKRNPSHCRKCPGHPLKSQCPHSRKGRAFITSLSSVPVSSVDLDMSVASNQAITTGIATPVIDPQFEVTLPATSHTPSQPIPISIINAGSGDLDLDRGDAINHLDMDSSGNDKNGNSDKDSNNSAPRTRTTFKNPSHGFVEGVQRGAADFPILRPNPLPTALTTGMASSTRYSRVIREVIARCEYISVQTGCWLFLGTQHPNARLPFVHYSSPSFRRDALHHVTAITNQLNGMFAGLNRARYQHAIEIQNRINAANKKASDAEAALKITEQALANKQKEIDSIMAMYQNSLA